MRVTTHKPLRRRSTVVAVGLNQLDLFASTTLVAPECSLPSIEVPQRSMSPPLDFQPELKARGVGAKADAPFGLTRIPRERMAPPRFRDAALRIVREADIPSYAAEDVQTVEQVLAAWPATKALFTYSEIRQSFGVSRATVARKLKRGLIPGIAFAGDRVIADGPVRRFTRAQVKFLLLCVRDRR